MHYYLRTQIPKCSLHSSRILTLLSKSSFIGLKIKKKSKSYSNFIKYLQRTEEKFRKSWRDNLLFFEKLHLLLPMIPNEDFEKKLMPIYMNSLQVCPEPTKQQICKTFAHVLQARPDFRVRAMIHEHMAHTLATSKSYKDRLIYIEFCSLVSKEISRYYFKDVFLPSFIDLARDKILSVLIKFYKELPIVRCAFLHDDIRSAEVIDKALRDLTSSSKQRDLLEIAKNAIEAINDYKFIEETKQISAEDKKKLADESDIKKIERNQMEQAKKKDIEGLVLLARQEYIQQTSNPKYKVAANGKLASSKTSLTPQNLKIGGKLGLSALDSKPSKGMSSFSAKSPHGGDSTTPTSKRSASKPVLKSLKSTEELKSSPSMLTKSKLGAVPQPIPLNGKITQGKLKR